MISVGMPAPAVPGGGFAVPPLELPPVTAAEPPPAQKGGFFSGWWGSSSDKKVSCSFILSKSSEQPLKQALSVG